MEKVIKISEYQHARTRKEIKSRWARWSKPLLRTPNVGQSQAVKLKSMAAMDRRDGLRKARDGRGKFM
jgi:hypothetical protein